CLPSAPLDFSLLSFIATAPPDTHPLSLHDALPIFPRAPARAAGRGRRGSASGAASRRAPPSPPPARRRREAVPAPAPPGGWRRRSEEHTSELQSLTNLVCRLLLEKKNNKDNDARAD